MNGKPVATIALPVRAVNTGRIRIEDAHGNTVARVDYSERDYNENRMIRYTEGVARAEEIARALNDRATLSARIEELEARVAELQPAAECWNALSNCMRITCMGWAGLGKPDESGSWPLPNEPGYAHATFNLWTHKPDFPEPRDDQDRLGRDVLAHFISRAVQNERLRERQVVTAAGGEPA